MGLQQLMFALCLPYVLKVHKGQRLSPLQSNYLLLILGPLLTDHSFLRATVTDDECFCGQNTVGFLQDQICKGVCIFCLIAVQSITNNCSVHDKVSKVIKYILQIFCLFALFQLVLSIELKFEVWLFKMSFLQTVYEEYRSKPYKEQLMPNILVTRLKHTAEKL